MELMVNGGFQEESEATKKWDRARLTSTQLSTYFVGSMEMWNLERERRVRAAMAPAIRAAPRPCRPRASWAASARRRASRTRSTWNRSSPTARRRSRFIRRILIGS
jgi:hypothetical protein